MKKLKFWNGRGHGEYRKQTIYIAAYNQKHARELLIKVCGYVPYNEISHYYSNCWGKGIDYSQATEPSVFIIIGNQVKRIL